MVFAWFGKTSTIRSRRTHVEPVAIIMGTDLGPRGGGLLEKGHYTEWSYPWLAQEQTSTNNVLDWGRRYEAHR